MTKLVTSMVLLTLLVSCGSVTYTQTGEDYKSRGKSCKFRIYTTQPKYPFDEIGLIDAKPGAYGSGVYTDVASFKEAISEKVCAAGGNAIIATVNGYGMYIKATVLRIKKGKKRKK